MESIHFSPRIARALYEFSLSLPGITSQNPKVSAIGLPELPRSLFASRREEDLRTLFTSFFNSDKESYLRIRGRYALSEDRKRACTHTNANRATESRCHGRVKRDIFDIAAPVVQSLAWKEVATHPLLNWISVLNK